MVALVKGQNMPLAAQQLKISVRMAAPGDLSALLLTPAGKVRSEADFAFNNQPSADGVRWASSGPDGQQLDLDLSAVPPTIERVLAVVSLDDRKFGQIQAPNARLCDATGAEIATFVITDLTEERTP